MLVCSGGKKHTRLMELKTLFLLLRKMKMQGVQEEISLFYSQFMEFPTTVEGVNRTLRGACL